MDSGFATLRHDKEHLRADDIRATLSSQKEPSSRRKSVQFGPRDQTEPDEHMYDLSKYLHKDVKRSDCSDKPQTKRIDKNVTVRKNRGQSQNEQDEPNRADVRETLAKDCFVDSLASSDLRLKIKQARPLNLNDAIRHAVELEAYFKAESNCIDASSYVNSFDTGEQQSASSCTDVQKLVNALATLQKSVEKIEVEMKSLKLKPSATKPDSAPQTPDNSNWKKNVKCHFC